MAYSYTISSPIDIRLPFVPDAEDPALNAELAKVYNAIRNLQIATTALTGAAQRDPELWDQLSPLDTIKSQNLNRFYVKAGEAISFGNVINVYDLGSGVLGVRKADATSTTAKPCHGFCDTVGGIALGAYGEVILMQGLCTAIGAMTIGTTYYLSTTPGVITNLKPSLPNLGQPIGFSLGPQILYFSSILT